MLYENVMGFNAGTSYDELATAMIRELAEKIMQDLNFEDLVGRHMACHNRFKSNELRDLEKKIEDTSTRFEQLEDDRYHLEGTWNAAKWDTRHGKVVLRI
jgi:hypothetical protein